MVRLNFDAFVSFCNVMLCHQWDDWIAFLYLKFSITCAFCLLCWLGVLCLRKCKIASPWLSKTIYSASDALKSVIVSYLYYNGTVSPLMVRNVPYVYCQVSLKPAQSSSAYAVSGLELMADPLKKMFFSIVCDMHLTTILAEAMCRSIGACRCVSKTDIAKEMSIFVHMTKCDKLPINNQYPNWPFLANSGAFALLKFRSSFIQRGVGAVFVFSAWLLAVNCFIYSCWTI